MAWVRILMESKRIWRSNFILILHYYFTMKNESTNHVSTKVWKLKKNKVLPGSKRISTLATYHTGFSMYMVPLNKWEQHGPDSNLTIAISLCFKHSSDEGPIFTIFYWKAVQGLKHIYVVKNTSSEMINCLDFVLPKPFLAFRDHLNTFCLF